MDPVNEGKLIEKVDNMATDIAELKERMKSLVTKNEFTPVKLIAYGMVGIILSAVLSQVLTLVLTKGA